MTADEMAVRVDRKYRVMVEKNPNITIEEVKTNLEMRDYIDSNKEISPLRKVIDAIELDNTHISIEEQLQKSMGIVNTTISE